MLQCMNYRLTMFIMRTVFHATMHELSSYYVHYENCVSCYNAWIIVLLCSLWELCFMLQCMNCRLTMFIMRTVFHATMHELLSYYVHYENCVSCYNAWIIVLLCSLWEPCFMLQCMDYRLTIFIMRTVFHATMYELSSCYVHYENCDSCYSPWTIVLLCSLWELCFMLQCMNYRLTMFIIRTVSCYNARTIVLLCSLRELWFKLQSMNYRLAIFLCLFILRSVLQARMRELSGACEVLKTRQGLRARVSC